MIIIIIIFTVIAIIIIPGSLAPQLLARWPGTHY